VHVFTANRSLQEYCVVTADERYLRDPILRPESEVVASYQPIMPSFAGRLSEDQIYQLLAYITCPQTATDWSEFYRNHSSGASSWSDVV
jgi:hypothetical protein